MLLTRQFASALLTGSERFADAAMLEVIQSVGAAVMIGATLMILPTVEGMFAAFVVATGVSGSIGVLRVNRLGVRWFGWPKRAVLTRLIHFGLRAAVGSAFQFLTYRLDFALVNLLASTQALGIYSVASRFAELLWVLPGAVGGALFAVRSRDPGAESAGQTARAFWGAGTVTVAGAVALALAAPIALPLLYGEAMTAAVAPLLILVPGAVLLGTSAVVANDVAARGRPGLISAIAIAVATLTVVLDIVMIPWLGIAGAAAASSIAYLAYGVMTVGAYLRVTGTHLTEFARAAGQLGSGMRLRL
jgi:O-antigen/teichoic acid export membrane protein